MAGALTQFFFLGDEGAALSILDSVPEGSRAFAPATPAIRSKPATSDASHFGRPFERKSCGTVDTVNSRLQSMWRIQQK